MFSLWFLEDCCPCSQHQAAFPSSSPQKSTESLHRKLLVAVSAAGIHLLPNQSSACPEGAVSFEI